MADQLKVDTAALRQARTDLSGVLTQFTDEHYISGQITTAVGHAALGAKLEHLSSMWSIRRGKIQADIEKLQVMLAASTTAFENTDNTLAADLRQASSGPAPAGQQ